MRIINYFNEQRAQLKRWWQGRISQHDLNNDLSDQFEYDNKKIGHSSSSSSSSSMDHHHMQHQDMEYEEEITGSEHTYEEEEEEQQTQNQYIPAAPQEDTVACPNTRYYVCP